MKLNQTVTTKLNILEQEVSVKPEATRVQLQLHFRPGTVHYGAGEQVDIYPDQAITLGTALIEAGNVTRQRMDQDQRSRESWQNLPTAFAGVAEALKTYLNSPAGRLPSNREDTLAAMKHVELARRTMADNAAGALKGTGITVTEPLSRFEERGAMLVTPEQRRQYEKMHLVSEIKPGTVTIVPGPHCDGVNDSDTYCPKNHFTD